MLNLTKPTQQWEADPEYRAWEQNEDHPCGWRGEAPISEWERTYGVVTHELRGAVNRRG